MGVNSCPVIGLVLLRYWSCFTHVSGNPNNLHLCTVAPKTVHMFCLLLHVADYSMNTECESMRPSLLDSQTSFLYMSAIVCLYTYHLWKYEERKQGIHVDSYWTLAPDCLVELSDHFAVTHMAIITLYCLFNIHGRAYVNSIVCGYVPPAPICHQVIVSLPRWWTGNKEL